MSINKSRANVDEQLNQKFKELFDTSFTQPDDLSSSLLGIMENIKIEKYTEALKQIATKIKEERLFIPSRQELFEQDLHHFENNFYLI